MDIKKRVLCAAIGAAQLLSMAGMSMSVSAENEVPVDTIAAGSDHSLVIRSDMSVWAAGDNSSGQLGAGSTVASSEGIKVLSGIVSVEANDCSSFAIDAAGTLYGWGDNNKGQVTPNSKDKIIFTPTKIMDGIKSVSAGDTHTVAVAVDGTVYGWGSNTYGELVAAGAGKGAAVLATGAVDAAAGDGFTAIVTSSGALYVCGNNENGQLGIGGYNDMSTLYMAVDKDVVEVEAGNDHLVVLKKDGTVWTAGLNDSGQLGLGNFRTRNNLTKTSLTGIESIFAGGNSTGAVNSSGKLYCWGSNAYGQLQANGTTNAEEPEYVKMNAISAAFGEHHSLVLGNDGAISAAGSGAYGELYSKVTTAVLKPEKIKNGIVAYSAGEDHAAAINEDGVLYTWGNNDCGQLGLGDFELRNKPTPVILYEKAVNVWAGNKMTFVLCEDSTVYVFGDNSDGLLGMDTRQEKVSTPVQNDYLSEYKSIKIYPSDGFCLALADGQVLGWGKNASHRMLDLKGTTKYPTSIADDLTGVEDIAVGNNHCIAIDRSDTLFAWGSNTKDQLGSETEYSYADIPQDCERYYSNDNANAPAAIAAAGNHTMVLDIDGTLWVWGDNSRGQLGTDIESRIDDPYYHVKDVQKIAAGETATGIITTEGELYMAGSNIDGALGTGTIDDLSSYSVAIAKDVTELSIGGGFAGYIREDGTLYSWGTNAYGQVGNSMGGVEEDNKVVITDALCGELIEPESLALDKTSAVVKPGKTIKLNAVFAPANANVKAVTWSSANKKVATVAADGTVTGVSYGTTVITAKTANGLKASCEVTVAIPVSSFSVYPKNGKTLKIGQSYTLTAKIYPAAATDKTLLYESSDSSVATVDKNGKITAVGAGRAKITVTAKTNPAKTRVVTIWVRPDKANITYRKATADGVVLKWDKVENADGYIILRREGKNGKTYSIADVTDLSYIDTTAKSGTVYYYGVRPYTEVDGKRVVASPTTIYKITAK